MHIDPFTILVFNTIASYLMSAGLFIMSRGYLSDVKGIGHYAIALLLISTGWLLFALHGIIPDFFSLVIGTTIPVLGTTFFFHSLVRFKQVYVPVRWAYLLVVIAFIGNFYFVHISFDLNSKIAFTSLCVAILLFANSLLLFTKQQGICPISHRLTGGLFAFCAVVSTIRAIYYLLWHTKVEQSILHANFIQDIFYLTGSFTIVGSSFGFVLMCNEKYIAEKNQAQSAKQEAFDRLHKIARHVPGVVFQINLSATGQFSVPYSSDGIQTIFKLNPEQVHEDASPIFERIYADDYHDFVASIHQSAQNLTLWSREFRVQFEDGSIHWLEGNAAPQRNQDGSILWHGFVSDITERKQVEQQLRNSETFTTSILNSLTAHIAVLDSEGMIIAVNNAWRQFADDNGLQTSCYAIGSSYFAACQKSSEQACLEDDIDIQDNIMAVLKGTCDTFHLEYSCHSPTEQRWFSMNVSPLNGLQQGVVVSHQNITERKQAEETIKQLAFYDPLTQLPNRRLLYERLKHGIELSHRTGKPMAVLMMDLDKFKAVNDNLGHAAGDELLQQVAIRIKARLREMDTVARLGGDEFVIILEEISHHEDIAHVANDIIVTLSQPFTLSQNHEVTIGASIGIGIYPEHGSSVDALMDNADTALYCAKDNGRGCFAYFSKAPTKK